MENEFGSFVLLKPFYTDKFVILNNEKENCCIVCYFPELKVTSFKDISNLIIYYDYYNCIYKYINCEYLKKESGVCSERSCFQMGTVKRNMINAAFKFYRVKQGFSAKKELEKISHYEFIGYTDIME